MDEQSQAQSLDHQSYQPSRKDGDLDRSSTSPWDKAVADRRDDAGSSPAAPARFAWLLPGRVVLPKGTARTVGEPNPLERSRERQRRWMRSPKGRAYYLQRISAPGYKAEQNERRKKWESSPAGKAWREANRERRNFYNRMRYASDPARRAYLNEKQRQYRSDPARRALDNQRRRAKRKAAQA